MSLLLTYAAYQVTLVPIQYAGMIYSVVAVFALVLGTWLARIPVEAP